MIPHPVHVALRRFLATAVTLSACVSLATSNALTQSAALARASVAQTLSVPILDSALMTSSLIPYNGLATVMPIAMVLMVAAAHMLASARNAPSGMALSLLAFLCIFPTVPLAIVGKPFLDAALVEPPAIPPIEIVPGALAMPLGLAWGLAIAAAATTLAASCLRAWVRSVGRRGMA